MSTRVERRTVFYSDRCSSCGKVSEIELRGYAQGIALIALCRECANQVIRKLAEDICALDGKRHD